MSQFDQVLGKKVKEIVGMKYDSENIKIYFEDDSCLEFYHDQSCCEEVRVEDVTGDVQDLIGQPLLMIEESSSNSDNPTSHYDELSVWTFYNFGSPRGYVTVRWLGESNGYYSVDVDHKYTPTTTQE